MLNSSAFTSGGLFPDHLGEAGGLRGLVPPRRREEEADLQPAPAHEVHPGGPPAGVRPISGWPAGRPVALTPGIGRAAPTGLAVRPLQRERVGRPRPMHAGRPACCRHHTGTAHPPSCPSRSCGAAAHCFSPRHRAFACAHGRRPVWNGWDAQASVPCNFLTSGAPSRRKSVTGAAERRLWNPWCASLPAAARTRSFPECEVAREGGEPVVVAILEALICLVEHLRKACETNVVWSELARPGTLALCAFETAQAHLSYHPGACERCAPLRERSWKDE
jgi:hypothetical protein